MVEPTIYRSGDPATADLVWLRQCGISNVVRMMPGRRLDMERAGFTVHYYPIHWWQQVLVMPSNKLLHAAVKDIGPGTLVQCKHGNDRTGLIVACYWMSQGYSKQFARNDMIEHGFHKSLWTLESRWQTEREEDWR